MDEAWSIEAVQHGDSFLINRDKLGVLCAYKVFIFICAKFALTSRSVDWSEHGRDILNFLLNYLPDESPSESPLPVHLTRLPEDISSRRVTSGFTNRTLVAIGLSFGGCSSYEF